MSEQDRVEGKIIVPESSDEYIAANLDQLTQDLDGVYPAVIEGETFPPASYHGNLSPVSTQERAQREITDLPPNSVIRLKYYRDQLAAAERAGVKKSGMKKFRKILREAA